MEVVLLKSHGLSHGKIAEIVGITENTLRTYLRQYQTSGIERLKELHFYKPTSELAGHEDALKTYFAEHPARTIKEAVSVIEKLTGVKRGLTQVRLFMQRMGLVRRKVGSIPSKADPEKQKIFKETSLDPILKKARQKKCSVFFMDAAHFVWAPFLGYLWSFTRVFIKAPAGRMRYNVLGALNAITKEMITVTNPTYINADSVCELLQKIREQVSGAVAVVLDNARYQRCDKVQAMADHLHIQLLFLPPYSPNLNLIERVWKFLKKEALNSRYYETFDSFRQAIDDCLGSMHVSHGAELKTLLSLRFQTFSEESILLAA